MVVLRNFPEKGGAIGESMGRNSLKRYYLSSASFPKKPLVGKVQCEIVHIFKRLLQLPTFPRDTVFGKVMTRCQVMREIITLKESIQPTPICRL
jgi:hypothetical protein